MSRMYLSSEKWMDNQHCIGVIFHRNGKAMTLLVGKYRGKRHFLADSVSYQLNGDIETLMGDGGYPLTVNVYETV
jgi:hypothetical protein